MNANWSTLLFVVGVAVATVVVVVVVVLLHFTRFAIKFIFVQLKCGSLFRKIENCTEN